MSCYPPQAEGGGYLGSGPRVSPLWPMAWHPQRESSQKGCHGKHGLTRRVASGLAVAVEQPSCKPHTDLYHFLLHPPMANAVPKPEDPTQRCPKPLCPSDRMTVPAGRCCSRPGRLVPLGPMAPDASRHFGQLSRPAFNPSCSSVSGSSSGGQARASVGWGSRPPRKPHRPRGDLTCTLDRGGL